MVDLIVNTKTGECLLTRNVKKGEIITYQNDYLKKINKVEKVNVLENLNKNMKLIAGFFEKGKIVIESDNKGNDYLVVKIQ